MDAAEEAVEAESRKETGMLSVKNANRKKRMSQEEQGTPAEVRRKESVWTAQMAAEETGTAEERTGRKGTGKAEEHGGRPDVPVRHDVRGGRTC